MSWLETKIPPPIVLLFAVLITWVLHNAIPLRFDEIFIEIYAGKVKLFVAGLFAAVACAFDVSAILVFLKAKTSIHPIKIHGASTLVCSGVYRITRNPMYVGLLFWLIAWSLYLGTLWFAISLPLFMMYIQTLQILPEERVLLKKFGEDYVEYKRRVPRWLFF